MSGFRGQKKSQNAAQAVNHTNGIKKSNEKKLCPLHRQL